MFNVQEVEVKDGGATVVITQPGLFAVDINGQMDDQVLFYCGNVIQC